MIEIPGYSIVGQIGKGGMATVYHARQVLLDRDVALKVMSPQLAQDPAYAQRFLQEARMLASLNHPHVVQVYDIGVSPGGLNYFSMQMLTGGDFVARLRDGLSEEELVRVLVAVAQALGFAHARGYVHRDVTPGNIMFDSHNVPVLTDFGIARALTSTSRITSTGLSIGTSHYMSPEQARGVEVDGRSDIYSLGVVTYEALVGTPPYDGEDGFAVAFAHVHDPVPRLPEEVARWQPLIDRAMAKEPAQRFPDCDAFIEGIREVAPEEFRSSGVGIQPIATAPTGKRRKKVDGEGRSWRPIALIGGALVVGVLIAVALWKVMAPSTPMLPVSVSDQPNKTPAVKPADPKPNTPPEAQPAPAEDGPATVADVAADGLADGEDMPADMVDGEPVPEHTVIDPVVTLIGLGKANIARLRLTAPPVTNALARFQTVFLFEPDNPEAHQGLADIGRAYINLAAEKDPDSAAEAAAEWLSFLQQGEEVAKLSNVGEPVLAEIAALREARASALIGRADTAVGAWDGARARALYAEALTVQPGSAVAQQGLQRAEQVGKPGYQFADAMKDGSPGPAMRVMGGSLAAALRPVTVGEFKRYWNAAGSRAHGSDSMRCNDKETIGLFGTSSKRSWMAPDVAQDDSHPVVCVNAAMADGYARWLSEQTGQRYRLPKGGELGVGSPGGCRENVRDASYRAKEGGRGGADCTDGFAGTAPVGSFPAQNGLFDTGGNVRIWTQDCEAGNCRRRIAIGRSWETEPTESDRKDFPADTGFNTIGIRVLRDIP
ncbi:MAG: protein kinase [Xanthomonadales bacterium]|nr:protein kinase [Xanthomonadales bacterium]